MSSWKARLLMVLTMLMMVLTMAAAPAMAHDIGDFGDHHLLGVVDDHRDRCDHNFRFCDDGGGVDAVSVAGLDCIEIRDDDGDLKRVICFDEFGRVVLNQRV